MLNKESTSTSLPIIQNAEQVQAVFTENSFRGRWFKGLKKVWLYLKGDNEETKSVPDPAAAIILQIEDREVARMVRDLHYKTPKSLQAMRKACEQCFVLPDDCPYYDYSIFDVKKAIRRLVAQPKHTHEQVVAELRMINQELAYHLAEYLD